MISGPTNVRPDGASAERTRLAWRRTVLSLTVVAMLTIRVAVRDGLSAWSAAAIATVAIGWLAALWLAQRRIRAMVSLNPLIAGRSLPATALLIAGLALLGIALVAAR